LKLRIGQLYDIEERARELSADARREVRVAEAEPVLDRIGARLAELKKRALPKSALSKAIWYTCNQWQALRRFTEDGRLPNDNNVSERALRHQAIGRKNWLFIGSVAAGSRAAGLMTIISTAARNDLDVWSYLKDVLDQILAGTDWESLRADRGKEQHPEAVRTYRVDERRDAVDQRARRRLPSSQKN
jgi:transposase